MLPPAEQQQVADALEHDAEVMSNTQLEEQLAGQPTDVQAEIIRINTERAAARAAGRAARPDPRRRCSGSLNSFRMMRLPDPVSSSAAEGLALG